MGVRQKLSVGEALAMTATLTLLVVAVGMNLWFPLTAMPPTAPLGTTPVEQIAEHPLTQVVQVMSPMGTGTGWVYSGGAIITNYHVVGAATGKYPVTFHDGTTIIASLIGVDEEGDIAVLALPPSILRSGLDLAGYEPIPGQQVVVLGYPFGDGPQISAGVLSKLAGSWYYTDADVSPGNSGGPMLDRQGRVLGMVARLYSGPVGDGWAMAIPHAALKERIERILND